MHGELEAHAASWRVRCVIRGGVCSSIALQASSHSRHHLHDLATELSLLASTRLLAPLDCSRARRGSSRRQSNLLATSAEMLAATSAVMFAATSSATSRVEHSFLRSSSVCHSCGPPSSASWVVSHPWVVLHPWASLHPWSLVRACTSQLAGRPTAPYRAPPRRRPRRLR